MEYSKNIIHYFNYTAKSIYLFIIKIHLFHYKHFKIYTGISKSEMNIDLKSKKKNKIKK